MKTSSRIVDAISNSIIRRANIWLTITCLLAAFLLSRIPYIQMVDNIDYFTLEDHEEVIFYEQLKEKFGNDEFFVIAIEADDVFAPQAMQVVSEITEAMESLKEVNDVVSLTNVDDVEGFEDGFQVGKFLEEMPDTAAAFARKKEQALANPLYTGALISTDATVTSVVVWPEDHGEDGQLRKRLLSRTDEIIGRYQDKVKSIRVAGWTVINFGLSDSMQDDILTLMPLTYFLLIIAVYFLFGSLWLTFLSFLVITLCLGSTLGAFTILGITLNNVTVIVIPLVMAIALCDIVHIFAYMKKRALHESEDSREALRRIVKAVLVPCFLASITTAFGFLSLGVSDIPPIKQFGVIGSVGIIFQFLFSFFFLPPLLLLIPAEKVFVAADRSAQGLVQKICRWLSGFVVEKRKLILLVSAGIAVVCAWALPRIVVDTNPIEYFRSWSKIHQDLSFVEKHLSGTVNMDVYFHITDTDTFTAPNKLRIIEEVQTYLKTLPEVDKTVSFADFIEDMNESFHNEDRKYRTIPDSQDAIEQYLLLYDSDDLSDYVTEDYLESRINLRLNVHSTGDHERVVVNIREYLSRLSHPGVEIRVGGWAVQWAAMTSALVDGQVMSLLLALGVISVAMVLSLGSISLGLLSLVPNVMPLLINFAVMMICNIPLDTGTALISAVVIGIVVDDTIHFLSNFKHRVADGDTVEQAVRATLIQKGPAMASSTIILCIGFSVLILGSFTSVAYFGFLTTVVMLSALVGDLLLMPALLLVSGNLFARKAN